MGSSLSCPAAHTIALSLSGGGSRAIAFHLGSLRALHELGILHRISVVSTVSGGSVIGALWAYSELSFEDFEAKVLRLLRSGLNRAILLQLINPRHLPNLLQTYVVAHPVNLCCFFGGLLANSAIALSNLIPGVALRPLMVKSPICRLYSRTSALESALNEILGPGVTLDSQTRNDLAIVINAVDLQSQTAFRFGNAVVGSYVLGSMPASGVRVATAVAASAAYPVLLPALDRRLWLSVKGQLRRQRVFLSDGGVFDNLGTSVLRGNRPAGSSIHVPKPDYIIASSAGPGRRESADPYWFVPRQVAATALMFRKLQDSGLAQLHYEKSSGLIKGFALAYLGQNDEQVLDQPLGYVRRESVINYPTNFSPMSQESTDRLVRRGYHLMKAVLKQHCAEIL